MAMLNNQRVVVFLGGPSHSSKLLCLLGATTHYMRHVCLNVEPLSFRRAAQICLQTHSVFRPKSSRAGPGGFWRNQPDREGVELPQGISIGRLVLSPNVSEKKPSMCAIFSFPYVT